MNKELLSRPDALEWVSVEVSAAIESLCELGFACCEEEICETGIECIRQAEDLVKLFYPEVSKQMARVQSCLGEAYGLQDRVREAFETYRKAKVIYEALGDQAGIAQVFSDLGDLCEERNEIAEALEYFKKAVELETNPLRKSQLLWSIAGCCKFDSDYCQACVCCENALVLLKELTQTEIVACLEASLMAELSYLAKQIALEEDDD